MNNPTLAAAQPEPSARLLRLLGYFEQTPDSSSLIFEIFDVCLAENQLAQAERMLADAIKLWPDEPGVLNRCAILALRRNDPQAAVVELEKILAAGKADTPVRYNLAYANYQLAEYGKARAALEAALQDADQLPALDTLYILTLQQLGDGEAAIAYAEQRLKGRAEDAELQGALALLYLDAEKDMAACRRYADAALRKNPNHPMALVAASALSMMDEQPGVALQMAERVVQHNPRDGRAWSSIGLAQLQMLNLSAAQQALKNAVQHMPGHIGTWHALAWTQLMLKDIDGAEASFTKALDIDRNFGETHGGLAIVAKLRGNKEPAIALMNRAKRLAPGSMSQQYLALLDLQDSGDNHAAHKFLEETLKRRPSFKGDSMLDMARRAASKQASGVIKPRT